MTVGYIDLKQIIMSNVTREVTTLDGLSEITTDLSLKELRHIQNIVKEKIEPFGLKVYSISPQEVDSQTITLAIDEVRYPVPVRAFALRDISYIANQVKMAHEMSQK